MDKQSLFDAAASSLGKAAAATSSTAARIGASGSKIAGNAASRATEAVDNARKALDEKKLNQINADIAEYAPTIERAKRSLEETSATTLLDNLGESPMPLTKTLARQIKESFPIPREQTIIWVDAEFDLRPSGIIATDKGVFVKSDATLFSFGKKDEEHNPTQSRLSYFLWEYFDPTWFVDESDSNPAAQVDPACSARFIKACSKISQAKSLLQVTELNASTIEPSSANEVNGKAAILNGAGMLSAEKAIFVEHKAAINNPGGHGEMAEEAINKLDRIHGLDAKVIGRDNAKNGADRIVDGILVQTKYYKSATGSVEACFDPNTGLYRYMTDAGKPMQLEVPKDQYAKALNRFKLKIKQGKVPGITDPEQAEEIIRPGRLTYRQAVNLAKPGTFESLAYDAATGAVICTYAFGISCLATTFMAYRKSGDIKEAIQAGIAAGVQVFGIAFVQHVVISQLSRTGLAGTLMAPSEYIVGKMGYQTSAVIINGLRALAGKQAIHGTAASKQLARILRSNAVTAAATFVIFSAPETYKVISKKASKAQYVKNITALAASVAGGMAGTAAAGVAAAKVAGAVGTAVSPGVGTAVGIAGGFVGGVAGTAAANAVGGLLHEGDSATFGRLFNAILSAMAVEYMFDENEISELIEVMNGANQASFKKLMEDTLSSDAQEETIREFLTPAFEEIAARREPFNAPSEKKITDALLAFSEEANESLN